MNTLVLLLALTCTAFGGVIDRLKRDAPQINWEEFSASCPGQCLDTWGDAWAEEFGRKLSRWADNIDSAEGATLPPWPRDKYDTVCGAGAETLKTCVQACTDDAGRKERMMNILRALKDIVCDDAIRDNIDCIREVLDTPSPTCDTQCEAKKTAVGSAYDDLSDTATSNNIDWPKVKTFGAKTCEFLNCRLVCRKPEYIQKCQQAGFDALKQLLGKTAQAVETIHAQYRPTGNFPTECKKDTILQGA